MRWRSRPRRRRRQRLYFALLVLVAVLACYWELVGACTLSDVVAHRYSPGAKQAVEFEGGE